MSTLPPTWDMYVEDHLMRIENNRQLKAGAIIGPGAYIWAQSDGFPSFKEAEMTSIMKEFHDPGTLESFSFGGETYMEIQHVGDSVIRARIPVVRGSDHKGRCIGGACYPIGQALSTELTKLLAAKAGRVYEDFYADLVTIPGSRVTVVRQLANSAACLLAKQALSSAHAFYWGFEPPDIISHGSNSGITIAKTWTIHLIGIYDQAPEECSKIVENLGRYIESKGH